MKTKSAFWQEYLKRIDKSAFSNTPQQYGKILYEGRHNLEKAIKAFREDLCKIPLGAAIANWIEGLDLPKEYILEYEVSMLRLIDLKLVPLTNEKGQQRTLNEMSSNDHEHIIEEIRCSPKLNTAEKEKLVEVYIVFSQYLSHMTCRLIVQGEDPDFQRTIQKVVKYNDYIQFVQLLPERDALIAKLLYFGAPTMDEVLILSVGQIDSKSNMVKYKKFSVKYPKHVMLDLKQYMAGKKKDDLIFVNLRGAQVERTHLNNCFNRASRKLKGNKKITPKMLIESDIAKGVSAHWPFSGSSIQ